MLLENVFAVRQCQLYTVDIYIYAVEQKEQAD